MILTTHLRARRAVAAADAALIKLCETARRRRNDDVDVDDRCLAPLALADATRQIAELISARVVGVASVLDVAGGEDARAKIGLDQALLLGVVGREQTTVFRQAVDCVLKASRCRRNEINCRQWNINGKALKKKKKSKSKFKI